MKYGQVFVRAKLFKPYVNDVGNFMDNEEIQRWVSADVLDLDSESFAAFTMDRLVKFGAVVSIKEEYVEGESIDYYVDASKVNKYLED